MSWPVDRFYDELAEDYHLIYADWGASVRRQGEVLDRILAEVFGHGRWRILDCSCGIGTQSLGLARLGHEVVGIDISAKAIQRARKEAKRARVEAVFRVCDVRTVAEDVEGEFDAVICCDNSLPHLLTEEDLSAAVRAMTAKARRGGTVLASIRNYDRLLEERPWTVPPRVHGDAGSRRVIFQLWSWHADGRSYDVEHFLGTEYGAEWSFRVRRSRLRAISLEELGQVFSDAGLEGVRWLMPEQSGYFQPIIVGSRP